MKNKKKQFIITFIILLIIAIVSIIGFALYQASTSYTYISDEEYQKYLNRDVTSGTGTFNKELTENNVQMDYMYKDNIGIKINNISLNENELNVITEFSLINNLKSNEITYNYILYDNYNRIIATQLVQNYPIYLMAFAKEKNIEYMSDTLFLKGNWQEGFIKPELSTDTKQFRAINFKSDELQEQPISSLTLRIFDISYQTAFDSEITPNERVYLTNQEWEITIDL